MCVPTADVPEPEGDGLGLQLKLLSLLENPAVIVAAAASGDVATLRDFLRKHPTQVFMDDHLCGYTYIVCAVCASAYNYCLGSVCISAV